MDRLDFLHLPNGEHCKSGAINMGQAIEAKTIVLEWVHVHPTGLEEPDDAVAKIYFFVAEALRGVGGIKLEGNSKRVANMLGRCDYATGKGVFEYW